MNDIESLKYPVGKFKKPDPITKEHLRQWIATIEAFPSKLAQLTHPLTEEQLLWSYRPDGWNIRQLIHHCADSHMNSFIRFKWTLTEDKPIIKAYYEDRWAELADTRTAPIAASLALLDGLHKRWVVMLNSLTDNELEKSFIHPETGKEVFLNTNIGLYAWHCDHHYAHILLALGHEGKLTN